MNKIIQSIQPYISNIAVWDNSVFTDYKVLGRYRPKINTSVVYTQDDDCIVDCIPDIIAAYEPGVIVSNMPHDHGVHVDHCLLGWGSLYDWYLPAKAFMEYWKHYKHDEVFERCCDIVFTALTPFKKIDKGHTSLDYAYGPDRMYNQPTHDSERQMVLSRCMYIRTKMANSPN